MRYIRVSMLASVVLAAAALAGPVNQHRIPADCTWLLHVDLEAARRSTLGPLLDLDREIPFEQIAGAADEVRALQDRHGVILGEDVRSVTLFGSSAGGSPEEEGVLVLEMGPIADDIVREMRAEAGDAVSEVTVDGYDLLKLEEGDGPAYGRLHPGVNPDQRFIVLSDTASRLTAALATIDGKSPSLADVEDGLVVEPREGTVVYLTVADIASFPDLQAASEVAKLAHRITVNIGEQNDTIYAQAAIATENAEDAGNVSDVLQGLIALGRLIASEQPDLQPVVELSRGLSIRADGASIELNLQVAADMLAEIMGESDSH